MRGYTATLGSDIIRDGMFLEIRRDLDDKDVLEVFFSDVSGDMTLTAWVQDLPLELVEWAIASAKRSLPPTA